jgi:hypothetical protein
MYIPTKVFDESKRQWVTTELNDFILRLREQAGYPLYPGCR